MDPDEKHRRRAQRKRQRRRIKEEENSIRRTSGAEELKDLQHIQNIRKEGEAFEDPTLHSLITTSSIQTESKNYQLGLKNNLNNHQICQIDTNEFSEEEQEAQKSLLNISASQVCNCPKRKTLYISTLIVICNSTMLYIYYTF